MVVGRSLPRAIAAAHSAGGQRAPSFETPTSATSNVKGNNRSPSLSRANAKEIGDTATSQSLAHFDQIGFDDMIAGHPRRAMEEVEMRSRLEVVKGEVEVALKLHGSMAKGERQSWLTQIERRNEENAYQVGCATCRSCVDGRRERV